MSPALWAQIQPLSQPLQQQQQQESGWDKLSFDGLALESSTENQQPLIQPQQQDEVIPTRPSSTPVPIPGVAYQINQNQNQSLPLPVPVPVPANFKFPDPLISNDSNSLNPNFIAVLYFGIALFFLFLGSYQLLYQSFVDTSPAAASKKTAGDRKRVWKGHFFGRGIDKLKFWLNLVFALGFLVLFRSVLFGYNDVSYLTVDIDDGAKHWQCVSYWVSIAVFAFVVLPLNVVQPVTWICQSATTLLFYPIQLGLLSIIAIQQNFGEYPVLQHPTLINGSRFQIEGVLSLALCVILAVIIHLEYNCYHPTWELYHYYESHDGYDVDQPNFVSKLTFSWMNGMIQSGYRNNGLEHEDLPPAPTFISTEHASPSLAKHWNKQLKKLKNGGNGKGFFSKPSLLIALARSFGFPVLLSLCYDMADSIVSFIQPQLLKHLILFFGRTDNPPSIIGMSIAFGMFAVSLAETSFNNEYIILTVEAALGSKSGLMQLVYEKSLKLSPEARLEYSTGDIINRLSVDINRVQTLTSYCQTLFSAPTRLVLCLWSLHALLGNATWGGIGTMLIMMPINTYLVKSMRKYHKEQMKLKDERTSIVNEMLQNVKSIKLYGWEQPMLDRVAEARNNRELKNLNKIGVLSAVVNFAWTCVPFFVSCSTFAIFALTSKTPLTPDIVFPALSLFDLLSDPIFAIPALMTALIECSVALNRLFTFLLADEIDDSVVTKLPRVHKLGQPTVKIENCTFMWGKENKTKKQADNYDEEASVESSKLALKNINFVAKKGELSCIVGRVGSGKSTFLQCLLGSLPTVPADPSKPHGITVSGTVAYCSQVPWIVNGSFKENILFGHEFDSEFYNKTIEVCQLLPDLEILPDGDETLVGEKGISLSGGQKARLSLARAIYTRADVYLLDDVLSAVDSHVGQKLIDQVLGKHGVLATKTRILATNSIKVLNHSKNISLLFGQEIEESSTFKAIVREKNSKLYDLIKEFGREEMKRHGTEQSLDDTQQSSSGAESPDKSKK
ncbi:unnamed protein product [Ambrosiozyma monospora]|uniref:Unnamed protein product n=1 Tax=Ambrosiozyma monospora TaxID=43982 RepID=A0ACB5ST61_AMBMO|nr:unnamed protein product [Ambrosiozyma monospora]